MSPICYMVTVAISLLVAISTFCTGLPSTLLLERVIPLDEPTNITDLISLDRARHIRTMWPSGGITNFSVGVARNNPTAVGIYYTRLQLGTPPKEFDLIADTGSYISWVSCTSKLNRNITYDPRSSSTSSFVTCDKRCKSGRDGSFCSPNDNQCHFSISYLDESVSAGFFVTDMLNYEGILGNQTFRSTAPFMFGCSTTITNVMQRIPLDGLLGLGRQSLSIISQLASRSLAPMVFSHCLSGDGNGGGSLVLGEVIAPNMVYSPMIHSELHYTITVEFVSVNGQKLAISPSVFSHTINKGATFDSGTTFAYMPTKAYNAFVEAVDSIVSSNAQVLAYMDYHCYRLTSNGTTTFPQLSFHFEGGAAFIIEPSDYLLQLGPMGGATMWCIAFHKHDGVTVLGDIMLRNKIVVYDLAEQRIGWTNYNCSASLNVSTEVKSDARRYGTDLLSMLFTNIIVVFILLLFAYPI